MFFFIFLRLYLSTCRTKPVKIDFISGHIKIRGHFLQVDVVFQSIFQENIIDSTAIMALYMKMLLQFAIVPGRPPGAFDFYDFAHAAQLVQVPVHGSQADPGNFLSDFAVDFIDSSVEVFFQYL